MRFSFVRPNLPPVSEWAASLDVAYENKYFTNFGMLETKLSQNLSDRFGEPGSSVTLCTNATSGLMASLIGHDVEGKVIIPDFTFPATLHAVIAARCEPVVCDIDRSTYELDAAKVSSICQKTKISAIIPVRAYGFVRSMNDIIDIASRYDIPVIIDSAAAFGNEIVHTSENVTEVFSLHATKSFGIGEGGLIFSHHSRRAKIKAALNFGLNGARFSYGLNGKMSEFQAAIGLAQLNHVDELIGGRKAMASWYHEILAGYEGLWIPPLTLRGSWSNFPVVLPQGFATGALEQYCHSRGYQLRRYYWPTLSAGYTEPLMSFTSLEVSQDISERAICLPLYSSVADEEKHEISEILFSAFSQQGFFKSY